MPIPVQLIYSDNPGSLPAEYTLPPGLDLELASVVARFNGSGASGSFIPTLEVLSSDDRVMARVRTDQVFAVGDTGVVTFAPFLRRRLLTPSDRASARIYITADQAVANNILHTVSFDTVAFDQGGLVNLAAFPTRVTAPEDGIYIATAGGVWDTNTVGGRFHFINSNLAGGTTLSESSSDAVVQVGFSITGLFEFTSGQYVELIVLQNSGGSRNLLGTAGFAGRCYLAMTRV